MSSVAQASERDGEPGGYTGEGSVKAGVRWQARPGVSPGGNSYNDCCCRFRETGLVLSTHYIVWQRACWCLKGVGLLACYGLEIPE